MSQLSMFTVCDFDIYNLRKETLPSDDELKETADNLLDAFKRDGMVFLKNTQLNMDMVHKLWQCFDRFLEQPSAIKQQYQVPFFTPLGDPLPLYSTVDNSGILDFVKLNLLESMFFVPSKDNIVYPDAEVPDFSSTMRSVWKDLARLMLRTTECIALAHSGDRHAFDYAIEGLNMQKNDANPSLMRMNYCAPLTDIEGTSLPLVNMAGHCDSSIITVIVTDREGLQVKSRDDEWVDVPVIPGTCAVLAGTVFPHICGKKFRALSHRVVSTGNEPKKKERRSTIGFLNIDTDAAIQPASDAVEQRPLYLRDFFALIKKV